MLHIVFWKWKQDGYRVRYTSDHANVMAAMVTRHMKNYKEPWRMVCITDDREGLSEAIEYFPLWKDGSDLKNASGAHLPSCYRRLKLFDPNVQRDMGIHNGDRIASMDLDAVICDDLAPIMSRKEKFIGWGVRGTNHIRVFNGSFFMFDQGGHADVWSEFDSKTSPMIANRNGFLGSDQSWLSYKLARQSTATGIAYPQIASYPKEVVRRPGLPPGTRIVFFNGKRKPWDPEVMKLSPWITKYWRLDT